MLRTLDWQALCRTCYGILMLLPQSDAFKTLATRLHSVPVQALQQLDAASGQSIQAGQASLDQSALISTFKRCQASAQPPRQPRPIV